MLRVADCTTSSSAEAYKVLSGVYHRVHPSSLRAAEPGTFPATALSRALTEAREECLRHAFREAFGALAERHRIALCAAGGTAEYTTARFSDLDLFLVSPTDLSGEDEFRDAQQRFRNLLLQHKFHSGVLYYDLAVSFDPSSLAGISSAEKRDRYEVKLAETYLSLLPARCIAGDKSTFESFRANYAESLRRASNHLLGLWHKSVLMRWEEFPHSVDSAIFDIKGSKGALRECTILGQIHQLCEILCIPDTVVTPQELQRVAELQEVLLRYKHEMHFAEERKGRDPNPDDRAFTGVTFEKLTALASSPQDRDFRLAELSATRDELARISARVHRRVADLLKDGTTRPVYEFVADPFGKAFTALKQETFAGSPDVNAIFQHVVTLFSAWKEKLGRVDPRKLLRTLSSLEHEVLSDLSELSALFRRKNVSFQRPTGLALRELFQQSGPRAPILELMARSGWLDLFIPEFNAARQMMQPKSEDPVTLARHGLETVRMLDVVLGQLPELEKTHPYYELTELFIEQPEVVYLAALCHDFGHIDEQRDDSKTHQEWGAGVAYQIAASFGYSHNESYRVAWLVQNHHTLRRIARQVASNDKMLGERVRSRVLDPDSLVMLYALTAADYLSNPRQRADQAMHCWLSHAFRVGSEAMNLTGVQRDDGSIKRRVAQDYAVQMKLANLTAMEHVEQHLSRMPPSYLTELSAEEIVQHLVGVSKGEDPYIQWISESEVDEASSATTRLQRVVVVAKDQTGLLSRMCGGVPFPIVEARVFTRADGFACNVISCAVPRGWLTSDLIRYTKSLRDTLANPEPPAQRLVAQYTATLAKLGAAPSKLAYEVTQTPLDGGTVQVSIKGPDRKHLASLIADIFPGITMAKFAGGPAGTINDSFILPHGIPQRQLRQLVARLNREAGILPEESVK